jgi:integrase
MNELLHDILHDHKPNNANSTDWVFKGHQGDYISTASFRDTWKLVLTGLGIEYRYPYQMKHTCLSFVATQQGLLAASKLARHKNVTMVAKHYARFVDEVKLPDYGI